MTRNKSDRCKVSKDLACSRDKGTWNSMEQEDFEVWVVAQPLALGGGASLGKSSTLPY